MRGASVLQKEIAQKRNHVWGSDPSSNMRGQTLASVLIENVQNPKRPAILRPVCDEVIGSHLIGPLEPEPEARSIGAPQSSAFWLCLRHLQAFVPPDGIHTIFLHRPPLPVSPPGNRSIAVSPVFLGERNHAVPKRVVLGIRLWTIPLSCSELPHAPAGAAFRDLKHAHGVRHGPRLLAGLRSFPQRPLLRWTDRGLSRRQCA